ncbi:5261_t:CDS:2, partial [Dentiscutata erythropus]
YSLLKWIILTLESKDKQAHANDDFEKGLSVLKCEIHEIRTAEMIHQNVYDEGVEFLSQCNTYRQTQDSNIRDDVLDRIFKSLKMKVNSAKSILFYVNQLTISQRSLAKLTQELQEIKVQIVQHQQEPENSKKFLYEQIEQNSKILKTRDRNEAVIYQAQLGSATNIRWSDDTFNNPIQLTKAIEKLHQKVDNFTKVKGKYYVINEKSALCLLEKYESKIRMVDEGFKLLVNFALQRMILELIFNAADELYKDSERDKILY